MNDIYKLVVTFFDATLMAVYGSVQVVARYYSGFELYCTSLSLDEIFGCMHVEDEGILVQERDFFLERRHITLSNW